MHIYIYMYTCTCILSTFLPKAENSPFLCLAGAWPLFIVESLVLRDIVEMAAAVEEESIDLLAGGRGGAKPLADPGLTWGPW